MCSMELYNVTANLKGVLSKSERAAREPKDNREAIDYAGWLKQYEASMSGSGSSGGGGEEMDLDEDL